MEILFTLWANGISLTMENVEEGEPRMYLSFPSVAMAKQVMSDIVAASKNDTVDLEIVLEKAGSVPGVLNDALLATKFHISTGDFTMSNATIVIQKKSKEEN